jgi:hypothetical protein
LGGESRPRHEGKENGTGPSPSRCTPRQSRT